MPEPCEHKTVEEKSLKGLRFERIGKNRYYNNGASTSWWWAPRIVSG